MKKIIIEAAEAAVQTIKVIVEIAFFLFALGVFLYCIYQLF